MKNSLRYLATLAAALGTHIAGAQNPPVAPPNPERLRQPEVPGAPPQPLQPPRPPGIEERRPDGPPRDGQNRGDNRRPVGRQPFDGRPAGGGFGSDGRDVARPQDGSEQRNRLLEAPAPVPQKPEAFLGVVTDSLEPALSAQLGLTEGLGLLVNHVLPESPAAKAGLVEHDIIKQINDQLVANPGQFATLIRHFGKDAEVALLIVRKGQEQKVTAKIGEHLAPVRRPLRSGSFGSSPFTPLFGGSGENFPRRQNDLRRDPQDRGPDPRERQPEAPPPRPSADIFREIGPGGAPDVKVEKDRVSTTWNTSNARMVLKDDDGEIVVRSEDGKRLLTAKNAKGETVFDGPIDTEEQRKAVPGEFRKKLERIEARSRSERRGGGPPQRPDRPQDEGGDRPRPQSDFDRGGAPRGPEVQ